MSRLRRRTVLLPALGACRRHPDGAARLATSAPRAFADDVDRPLPHGPCPTAHQPPVRRRDRWLDPVQPSRARVSVREDV
ncbi:hypothetical protein AV521_31940 [Streptomyces sp. IMTB 2501]|uniref:hypothetical protein n=1 Tax=Streptomyces sp. IMTB 2501 TaxID=1776340 RepID=UPI00096FFD8B|nr:hypothetical protein [Streptomyces sp. IMTB 2501]OLZ65307.1 hypothetical protein AV521_31940 [Streptomyces sp. IMTB 2501]